MSARGFAKISTQGSYTGKKINVDNMYLGGASFEISVPSAHSVNRKSAQGMRRGRQTQNVPIASASRSVSSRCSVSSSALVGTATWFFTAVRVLSAPVSPRSSSSLWRRPASALPCRRAQRAGGHSRDGGAGHIPNRRPGLVVVAHDGFLGVWEGW